MNFIPTLRVATGASLNLLGATAALSALYYIKVNTWNPIARAAFNQLPDLSLPKTLDESPIGKATHILSYIIKGSAEEQKSEAENTGEFLEGLCYLVAIAAASFALGQCIRGADPHATYQIPRDLASRIFKDLSKGL